MEKHSYTGKSKEEAIENAKIDLQELEENLIIRKKEEIKGGLFKSKKVEIEVIEKREVVKDIKEFLINLLKNLGFQANIEVKVTDNIPKYTIFSDNDSLLIGKNGKNLQALSVITSQYVKKEVGTSYKFILDVNAYKEKHERQIERLAKKTAREVAKTKIEAKMDSMNSYERRIVHNVLNNNKRVYTESEGEQPNRYVVIKPKEDE